MTSKGLATGLLAAALALGSLAAPVAAGTVSRVVDDDGHATATNCDAGAVARAHIQNAVNASGPGDRILVCPGIYQEQLKISSDKTDLTIRAITENTAEILTPAVLAGLDLIEVDATGVTIRGFKIKVLAGSSGCQEVFATVYIAPGASALITHDRIGTLGASTQGPCGYDYGVYTDGGGPVAGETAATITFDRIKNFRLAGALITNPGATAIVTDNVFRFNHHPAGTAFCLRPEMVAGPAGVAPAATTAISFRDSSGGEIRRNIISTLTADECNVLGTGVAVQQTVGAAAAEPAGPAPATVFVSNNVIQGATIGLLFRGDQKIRSADDSVTGAGYGAWLYGSTDAVLLRFKAKEGVRGILVDISSTGNKIRDSNVRGNSGIDCHDDSTGGSSGGTGNKWLDVKGDDANRAGICIPGVVAP